MTSLSKLLEKFYIENSRYDIVPPAKTIKELESGKLVLSDYEIGDEEIPIIVRFVRSKAALKYITNIEVNKTSGSKVNKRRTNSALNTNGAKLFRELIHFFQNCQTLESLTFDSVEISPVMASSLCRAVADNCVGLRWLMFKDCDIDGDNGMKAMSPFLSRIQLQVLGLECCNLTDASFPYICSFLKAQECNSDALFWNATLRTDPYMNDKQRIREETGYVYSRGLVALSLFGNRFTGQGMEDFNEIIRKNYWLLGLNLAENKLTEEHLNDFIEQMSGNQVLQVVLLRNNPGLTADNCLKLYKSVFAKMQGSDDFGNNGFARLNLLGASVSWMVKSWMRLQCEETRDLLTSSSPLDKNNIVNTNYNTAENNNTMNFDKTQASVSSLGASMTGVGGMFVSRSPRRQREIERKILLEEAKEYSVLAYSDPQYGRKNLKNESFRASIGSDSGIKANGLRSSAAAVEQYNSDFEAVPPPFRQVNGDEDDNNDWESAVPVPSPPLGGKYPNKPSSSSSAAASSSKKRKEQEQERESEFFGYWPDEYVPRNATSLERPPSRISIRPRTALAASLSPADEFNRSTNNNSNAISSVSRRSVSAVSQSAGLSSPVMSGRHSRATQAAYDIKDIDLVSNHRYIPRYYKAKHPDNHHKDMVDITVPRRIRSSSADAVGRTATATHSASSRAKSPPWRPPSAHHQETVKVVKAPLTKNAAVLQNEVTASMSEYNKRLYRDDIRDHHVLHYQPRSARQIEKEDEENVLFRRNTGMKLSGKKNSIKIKTKTMGETRLKKKKKTTKGATTSASATDIDTYKTVSKSVVNATKKLEAASERLLSVAESLSESAIVTNVNLNHSYLSANTSGTRTHRNNNNKSNNNNTFNGHSHLLYENGEMSYLSNGSSVDDTALEELVRARLNFNLRKTLNDALQGEN